MIAGMIPIIMPIVATEIVILIDTVTTADPIAIVAHQTGITGGPIGTMTHVAQTGTHCVVTTRIVIAETMVDPAAQVISLPQGA